ncbi:hypothetical protein D3C73_1350950 [compost metagenome]
MALRPRSVTFGLVEPGVMEITPASSYTSEAGMVLDEQKCPTTPATLSWSTRRLATATACFGSQASSPATRTIFSPLTPPAALMASAAACAPFMYCSPNAALGPVIGPATPILMSA